MKLSTRKCARGEAVCAAPCVARRNRKSASTDEIAGAAGKIRSRTARLGMSGYSCVDDMRICCVELRGAGAFFKAPVVLCKQFRNRLDSEFFNVSAELSAVGVWRIVTWKF